MIKLISKGIMSICNYSLSIFPVHLYVSNKIHEMKWEEMVNADKSLGNP